MKKTIIAVITLLILPAVLFAGFNFGLVKAAKKTVEKVDKQVVIKKAESAPIAVNHSPSISSVFASPATISTGAVSAITCSASDSDGDVLTYIWSAASGTISGTGAVVNWNSPSSSSTYVIDVTVADGHGASAQSSVNVPVTKSNNNPVISSIDANPTTISTGAVTTVTCTASDADNDALTYTWSAGSGTISGTGSFITWTAPASSSTYTINLTVSDGHGGSVQSSKTIVVTKLNNSPAISTLVVNPTTISTGATTTMACTASDLDGDALTYTWSAASGTISGTGSSINWTAPASSSTYTINVTVSDGHSGSVQGSTTVVVTKLNNSPVISSLVASPTTILTGAVSAITCSASDLDGNTLTYTWSAASGTISGAGSTVNWTAPASSGNYVVGVTVTDGQGGSVQRSTTVAVTYWITYSSSTSGLVNNYVQSSGIDGSGNIWFGTQNGISKFTGTVWSNYTTANSGLVNNVIWSIAIDGTGNKWFGTGGGGVSKFDGTTWTTYSTANGLVNNQVASIVIDGSGNKWFGTYGGVSKYDGTTWMTYTTANGLGSNTVYGGMIDGSGNIWFGSYNGGASKFDGTTWTTYTTANGLASNDVQQIAEDGLGNIWFATYGGGVSKFDGITWTTYTTASGLASNNVRSVKIDGLGNKWFGTDGSGISKFDGTTWTTYTTASGLANNIVFPIIIDASGNKWFGTMGGVSKYTGN